MRATRRPFLFGALTLLTGCALTVDAPEIEEDRDGDGVEGDEDCNDAAAGVGPEAIERCNGVDDDCDGEIDEADAEDAALWYPDLDRDGFGDAGAEPVAACLRPPETVANADDCDDEDPTVRPGAAEICDGVDNDCSADTSEDGLVVLDDGDIYGSITEALAAASEGSVLGLCSGRYDESVTLDRAVTLTNHRSSTVPRIAPSSGPAVVVETTGVTLSGIELYGGDGIGIGAYDYGGCLFLDDGAQATLDDVEIRQCDADFGGGAYLGRGASLTLADSAVRSNDAGEGGGVYVFRGTLELVDTDIRDNDADYGGGVSCADCTLTADEDTSIRGNEAELYGSGALMLGDSSWSGGVIEDNEGFSGAGLTVLDTASVSDLVIEGNEGGVGVGLVALGGTHTFRNVTLRDNVSTRYEVDGTNYYAWGAGALLGGADLGDTVEPSDTTFVDCAFHDNTSDDYGGGMVVESGSTVRIEGSEVFRNDASTGSAAWLVEGVLASDGSDWGTGSDDNGSREISIYDRSSSYAFATESFTCTSETRVCTEDAP